MISTIVKLKTLRKKILTGFAGKNECIGHYLQMKDLQKSINFSADFFPSMFCVVKIEATQTDSEDKVTFSSCLCPTTSPGPAAAAASPTGA